MPSSTDGAFLTAKWVDLAIITYRVSGDCLRPFVHHALELDRLHAEDRGDDDVGYISLVAFCFRDTLVKGISVPFHRDFPEVNLRIYVRTVAEPRRRGVTFVQEIVPKPAITAVANHVYNENYRTLPVTCDAKDVHSNSRILTCRVDSGTRIHRFSLTGSKPPRPCSPNSLDEFFKEHTWGFGRRSDGALLTYRVEHPRWDVYPTDRHNLTLDFNYGDLYGESWQFLDNTSPYHVAFAVGSKVTVYDPEP